MHDASPESFLSRQPSAVSRQPKLRGQHRQVKPAG